MVIPVEHDGEQVLMWVRRGATSTDVDVRHIERVRFVPLIGAQGE